MSTVAVFSYGTLITGALDPAVGSLVARYEVERREASLRGRLVDLGAYPGLLTSGRSADRVRGQVIRLRRPDRCLPTLDAYEDCTPEDPAGGLYRREWTQVRLADGGRCGAWVYWYNGAPTGLAVAHGDWCRWLVQAKNI